MNRITRLIIIVFFFSVSRLFTQSADNLNIFYKLIEESVAKIDSSITDPQKNIFVKLSIPQPLDQLQPKVVLAFMQNGYTVKDASPSINYSLIDAHVKYKEPYKDGLFGDILTQREIEIGGAYFIASNQGIEEPVYFNKAFKDTIVVDDIPNLENKSLPFTQGEVPPPPLLSNLIEPIIVIGAIITTVILFFTVRSK